MLMIGRQRRDNWLTEAESFYGLKRDVERLSCGEEAELKDIIKRIKIAIMGTFGV